MFINQIPQILPLLIQNNDSLLLCSKHGIGKSSVFKQFALTRNYHFEPLLLSNYEIGDLIGIPVEKDGLTVWSVPLWIQRIIDKDNEGIKTILLLDELNRAQIDVLQGSLELVLENRIGSHQLPKSTYICAAINPPGDYQTVELDPALIDRFNYINVEVSAPVFLEYAKEENLNDHIIHYISQNPNHLHYNGNDEIKGSSPRSFETVSTYLDNFNVLSDELMREVLCGKLGITVGLSVFNFVNSKNTNIISEFKSFIIDNSSDSISTQISKASGFMSSHRFDIKDYKQTFNALLQIKNQNDAYCLYMFLNSLPDEVLLVNLQELKKKHKEVYVQIVNIDDALNGKKMLKRLVTV